MFQQHVRVLLALASAGALSACAAPARTTGPAGPPDGAPPAYETFDAAAHPAPPPAATAPIVHDVPPRLMEGRVDVPTRGTTEPATRVVDGFRIQVFSGEDRAAAERVRSEAEAWSRGQGGAARGLRAEVAWLQPYYRVRVGAFASREQAESALAAVRTRFPEAFLVPDLVTVTD